MTVKSRTAILSILIIFLCGCLPSQETERNDLEIRKLNGSVKSTREVSYRVQDKFGEILKIEKKSQYAEYAEKFDVYNKQGNLTKEVWYYPDGKQRSKIETLYDNDGREIESKSYDTQNTMYSVSYKFYKDGNLIEKNWKDSRSNVDYKYEYDYDKRGNMIEEVLYSNGKIHSKKRYKYDDMDNETEYSFYNSNGNLKFKYIYINDHNGNTTEFKEFNSKGELDKIGKSKYNDLGKNIKTIHYDSKGKITWWTARKYDDQGRQREGIRHYPDGSIEVKYLYRYNDNGFIEQEITHYPGPGELYIKENYQYVYDFAGNWIEKLIIVNEIPEYLIEREIEYF